MGVRLGRILESLKSFHSSALRGPESAHQEADLGYGRERHGKLTQGGYRTGLDGELTQGRGQEGVGRHQELDPGLGLQNQDGGWGHNSSSSGPGPADMQAGVRPLPP